MLTARTIAAAQTRAVPMLNVADPYSSPSSHSHISQSRPLCIAASI
jgi:hypothetical protein